MWQIIFATLCQASHISFISVPSYQGNAIQDATLVLKIGGKQVTEHLMNLLMNGKYSFPDDNFLLWRKKKKTKFTVSSRKEIIREMKVITIELRMRV